MVTGEESGRSSPKGAIVQQIFWCFLCTIRAAGNRFFTLSVFDNTEAVFSPFTALIKKASGLFFSPFHLYNPRAFSMKIFRKGDSRCSSDF